MFYDRLVDNDDRLCFFEIVKVRACFLVVEKLLKHYTSLCGRLIVRCCELFTIKSTLTILDCFPFSLLVY